MHDQGSLLKTALEQSPQNCGMNKSARRSEYALESVRGRARIRRIRLALVGSTPVDNGSYVTRPGLESSTPIATQSTSEAPAHFEQ